MGFCGRRLHSHMNCTRAYELRWSATRVAAENNLSTSLCALWLSPPRARPAQSHSADESIRLARYKPGTQSLHSLQTCLSRIAQKFALRVTMPVGPYRLPIAGLKPDLQQTIYRCSTQYLILDLLLIPENYCHCCRALATWRAGVLPNPCDMHL
jgi:hypothetical protein